MLDPLAVALIMVTPILSVGAAAGFADVRRWGASDRFVGLRGDAPTAAGRALFYVIAAAAGIALSYGVFVVGGWLTGAAGAVDAILLAWIGYALAATVRRRRAVGPQAGQ